MTYPLCCIFYTLSDINGLIKFYSTPLGKKHAALESKLEKRFDELLEEKLNSMIPQMTTWFKENLNINIPEHDTNQTADSDDDNDDVAIVLSTNNGRMIFKVTASDISIFKFLAIDPNCSKSISLDRATIR